MTKTCDLDIAHYLLDAAREEAAGWLLQAGVLLQACAVLAGPTGALDLIGLLPHGYETDRQIDILLLVVAQELFLWGSRWTRRALARPDLFTEGDGV